MPQLALTVSPIGPETFVEKKLPLVALTNTSTVPSPPSAIGNLKISASGNKFEKPTSIASATLDAERVSLKESGAITIFIKFNTLEQFSDQIISSILKVSYIFYPIAQAKL